MTNQKIELAQNCFNNWKQTSFTHRAELLKSVANQLRINKSTYASIISEEMGKIYKESEAEIEKCALVCDYYAQNGANFLKDEFIESDASQSFISYEPLGVVLAVMPWNFPFWQVFRFAAPAIMAGNTALLKHASNVPKCALAIESIFKEASAPKGLFQTLLINAKAVKSVIENPLVKAVTLTGSEFAGSKVAETAGGQIKKQVLELGGSDAFIVLADANLKKAADIGVLSRFLNCGQSCIAAKRFIVVEEIAEQFLQLFKQKTLSLKQSINPLAEGIDIGPMARIDLAEELEQQLNQSIKLGAKLICGGKRDGALFEPTIITNVKKGMPAYHQEMFGPVAAFIVVKDVNEALKIANDSDFGLGGSVWTENKALGIVVAKKIETGAVFVNGLVKSDPRLPFGGIKRSGYGRELSYLGIREFTNQKTIWVG